MKNTLTVTLLKDSVHWIFTESMLGIVLQY